MPAAEYAVRVLRPYRYSPNGTRVRAVFAGMELGVPEEVSEEIALLMIHMGVAEKIEFKDADEPTGAEILDSVAAKKKTKTKRAPKRKTTRS
jgi:hypothetical protein